MRSLNHAFHPGVYYDDPSFGYETVRLKDLVGIPDGQVTPPRVTPSNAAPLSRRPPLRSKRKAGRQTVVIVMCLVCLCLVSALARQFLNTNADIDATLETRIDPPPAARALDCWEGVPDVL